MKQVKRDAFSRRRRLRWKLIIPLLVLVLLLVYIGVTLANPHKVVVVQPKYAVCDYSLSKAQAEFKKMTFDETVELKEHLYYGETLNLYNEAFQLGKTDPFIGQSVILVNICTGEEKTYDMNPTIDDQISLDVLPVGFYEVYIKKNMVSDKVRLVSETVVHDQFYTVRRSVTIDEEVKLLGKEIELVADRDLIEPATEGTTIFDKNYVFIRVLEKEVSEAIYDVVIDPSRNQIEDPLTKNGINIPDALVESANLLKEKLEAYGLKVLVLRGNEVLSRWGSDGRMAKLYASKAKYCIALDLNFSTNPSIKGATIMYSHYASNSFASRIFEQYLDSATLTAYGGNTAGNNPGILRGKIINFMDSYTDIRESGGKILGAGLFDEYALLNREFASENPYGAQSILLDLLWVTNSNDKNVYMTQHDLLMEGIASGFAQHLKLEKITP